MPRVHRLPIQARETVIIIIAGGSSCYLQRTRPPGPFQTSTSFLPSLLTLLLLLFPPSPSPLPSPPPATWRLPALPDPTDLLPLPPPAPPRSVSLPSSSFSLFRSPLLPSPGDIESNACTLLFHHPHHTIYRTDDDHQFKYHLTSTPPLLSRPADIVRSPEIHRC